MFYFFVLLLSNIYVKIKQVQKISWFTVLHLKLDKFWWILYIDPQTIFLSKLWYGKMSLCVCIWVYMCKLWVCVSLHWGNLCKITNILMAGGPNIQTAVPALFLWLHTHHKCFCVCVTPLCVGVYEVLTGKCQCFYITTHLWYIWLYTCSKMSGLNTIIIKLLVSQVRHLYVHCLSPIPNCSSMQNFLIIYDKSLTCLLPWRSPILNVQYMLNDQQC